MDIRDFTKSDLMNPIIGPEQLVVHIEGMRLLKVNGKSSGKMRGNFCLSSYNAIRKDFSVHIYAL